MASATLGKRLEGASGKAGRAKRVRAVTPPNAFASEIEKQSLQVLVVDTVKTTKIDD